VGFTYVYEDRPLKPVEIILSVCGGMRENVTKLHCKHV
jgi:hypothetical protein